MKKTGELLYLRYNINLLSDLLSPPDFYWDRPKLESLYSRMCKMLDIQSRTHVVNSKLNHCQELAQLLRTQLHEEHSVKLEWCIIWLITLEVVFELLHYMEKWMV